jgi:hypothetical protein
MIKICVGSETNLPPNPLPARSLMSPPHPPILDFPLPLTKMISPPLASLLLLEFADFRKMPPSIMADL